jgi:membrane associated rhomboid family serine protease
MRLRPFRPPSIADFAEVPATVLLCAAPACVWIAEASGRDISRLEMDILAFHGEPWRIFTSALPHGDLLHLVLNLVWIWRFGATIERRFGSLSLVAAALVFDAGSTLAEFALFGSSIGLSGIGYGFFGMLWALRNRDPRLFGALERSTIQLFIAWFFFCIIATITGTLPVANVAHAMGGLLGYGVGLAIGLSGRWRFASAVLVPLALVVSLLGCTVGRPHVAMSQGAVMSLLVSGGELEEEGRFEEALLQYQKARRLDPKNVAVVTQIVMTYMTLDREEQAEDLLKEAMAQAPDEKMLRSASGIVKLRLAYHRLIAGRLESAIALSQEGLAIVNIDVGWHNLGVAYSRSNRPEEASAAFDKARKGHTMRRQLAGKLGNCLDPLWDFVDGRDQRESYDYDD